jgi:glycosyltransferase involved in cell wall biosynthesis
VIRIFDLPNPPQGKTGWPWTEESEQLPVNGVEYPKITIVTPSFSQGKYIEETIRSILLQNYPAIEFIVIDGGSTDETVTILQKYSAWITKWVSEKDSGQSNAINKALRMATGEIFNWINSDDYLTKNALHKIARAFNANPDKLCVRGNIYFFSTSKGYYSSSLYFKDDAENIGHSPVRILQPATFFKRSLFSDNALGQLNEEVHYAFDLEWMIKFLFRYGSAKLLQIPDVLCNFRLHESSKTLLHNEKFEQEINSFFFSFACQAGNVKIQEFFKKEFPGTYGSSSLTLTEVKHEMLVSSLNYYMFYLGKSKYALMQRPLAQKAFDAIETRLLSKDEQKLLMWLKFKNRFFPWRLINFLRKK